MRRFPALLLAALLAGCAPAPAPTPLLTTDLSGATHGRDFALADHQGRPRSLADFRGRVVIIAFGYTRCPDVCPTTLAELAGLMHALGDEARRVQVLFVTLDPERDSAELLARYVPAFHPSFLGLRGDTATTARTAAEYRVAWRRVDTGSAAGYAIDHATGSFVYDPAGRLRAFFPLGGDAAAMIHDVRALLVE